MSWSPQGYPVSHPTQSMTHHTRSPASGRIDQGTSPTGTITGRARLDLSGTRYLSLPASQSHCAVFCQCPARGSVRQSYKECPSHERSWKRLKLQEMPAWDEGDSWCRARTSTLAVTPVPHEATMGLLRSTPAPSKTSASSTGFRYFPASSTWCISSMSELCSQHLLCRQGQSSIGSQHSAARRFQFEGSSYTLGLQLMTPVHFQAA